MPTFALCQTELVVLLTSTWPAASIKKLNSPRGPEFVCAKAERDVSAMSTVIDETRRTV